MKKIFFLFLLLLITAPAHAKIFRVTSPQPMGPLIVRTQNPLYLLFYGEIMESAHTLPAQMRQITADVTFTNLFERRVKATGIGLDLDMELWRGVTMARYGFSDFLELGLEIPFQGMGGGFLDAFIQNYHNAFGFPNAGRDLVPNGSYAFLVTSGGAPLYSAPASVGLGDISLSAKWKLAEEEKWPGLAVKAAFKIPTGSASKGLGSGNPDGAMALYAQKSFGRFHSYTEFGFVANGGTRSLGPILRPFVVTAGQAFEFNLGNHLSALVQLNTNTPLFHGTGLTELDHMPLDLVIGLRGQHSPAKGLHRINWQVAFTEDPAANDPSIDFSVNGNVSVEF